MSIRTLQLTFNKVYCLSDTSQIVLKYSAEHYPMPFRKIFTFEESSISSLKSWLEHLGISEDSLNFLDSFEYHLESGTLVHFEQWLYLKLSKTPKIQAKVDKSSFTILEIIPDLLIHPLNTDGALVEILISHKNELQESPFNSENSLKCYQCHNRVAIFDFYRGKILCHECLLKTDPRELRMDDYPNLYENLMNVQSPSNPQNTQVYRGIFFKRPEEAQFAHLLDSWNIRYFYRPTLKFLNYSPSFYIPSEKLLVDLNFDPKEHLNKNFDYQCFLKNLLEGSVVHSGVPLAYMRLSIGDSFYQLPEQEKQEPWIVYDGQSIHFTGRLKASRDYPYKSILGLFPSKDHNFALHVLNPLDDQLTLFTQLRSLLFSNK